VTDHREFWIFEVIGGEEFDLRVKGNPAMRHDGRRSIVRCLCTDEQAVELEEEMKRRGCRVRANSPRETEEQAHEREDLVGVLGGERSLPCERCLQCAWFDPHLDGMCAAGMVGLGWTSEAVHQVMTREKFRADFESCPLREVSH
jgi:hypothetical protein